MPLVSILIAACTSDRQLPNGLDLDSGPVPPRDADHDTADGGRDGDADEEPVCDEMDLPVVRVTPRVLIVLDRSVSMASDGAWDAVREAIYDVTRALQSRIAFGLMVFPRADGRLACSADVNVCEPARTPSVSCRSSNASEIRRALRDLGPCGGTPTALTLEAAAEYFREAPSVDHVPAPRDSLGHVLLATDGAPNCNDDLDPDGCRCTGPPGTCDDFPLNCLDHERTYQAVADLNGNTVDVYVLGIDASAWADVLDEMARLGGTEAAYFASDPSAIEDDLESITQGLTTCEVVLDEPEPVADPEKVNFYVDGERVPHDPECTEGWAWDDEQRSRVVFCGSWCERIRSGEVDDVTATFVCPTLI